MTAIEMRVSLLQEVATILDDEKLVKKALASLRRLKSKAAATAAADEYQEPTKEEILEGIREGLQAIKDREMGRDVTGKFMDLKDFLNEL